MQLWMSDWFIDFVNILILVTHDQLALHAKLGEERGLFAFSFSLQNLIAIAMVILYEESLYSRFIIKSFHVFPEATGFIHIIM